MLKLTILDKMLQSPLRPKPARRNLQASHLGGDQISKTRGLRELRNLPSSKETTRSRLTTRNVPHKLLPMTPNYGFSSATLHGSPETTLNQLMPMIEVFVLTLQQSTDSLDWRRPTV